jgi:hypothetical protein
MKEGTEKEFEKWRKIHRWKMDSVRLCRECAFDISSMVLGRCPGVCQMCGEHKKDTNWYGIGWLIEQISGVKFDDQCIPTGKIERKAGWPPHPDPKDTLPPHVDEADDA